MFYERPKDYGWKDTLALLPRTTELVCDVSKEPKRTMLRAATETDGDLLFKWVNQPDSLENKLKTSGPVERSTHVAWLDDRLASPDCRIWIIEQDRVPVGQIRLEGGAQGMEVDIYLDSAARGRGIAATAIKAAGVEASRLWPGVPLIARIKRENMPSRRLFAKVGYREVTSDGDHMIYRRDPAVPKQGKR